MARDTPIHRALIMKGLRWSTLAQSVAQETRCVRFHSQVWCGTGILLVPMKEGPAIFELAHTSKNRGRDAGATKIIQAALECFTKNEFPI